MADNSRTPRESPRSLRQFPRSLRPRPTSPPDSPVVSEPRNIPRKTSIGGFVPPTISPLEVPAFPMDSPPSATRLSHLKPSSQSLAVSSDSPSPGSRSQSEVPRSPRKSHDSLNHSMGSPRQSLGRHASRSPRQSHESLNHSIGSHGQSLGSPKQAPRSPKQSHESLSHSMGSPRQSLRSIRKPSGSTSQFRDSPSSGSPISSLSNLKQTQGSPRQFQDSPSPVSPSRVSPSPVSPTRSPANLRQTPRSSRPQSPPDSPVTSAPRDTPRKSSLRGFTPPILSPLEVPIFDLDMRKKPIPGRKSPKIAMSSHSLETNLPISSPRARMDEGPIDVVTTHADQHQDRTVPPDHDTAKKRLSHLDNSVTSILARGNWTAELRDLAQSRGMIVRDVDDDGKSLFESVYAVMYYLGYQQETCGFDLIFRLATFLDKPDVKAYLHDKISEDFSVWRDGLCTCDRLGERHAAILALSQLLNIVLVVHQDQEQAVVVAPRGGQPVCTVHLAQLTNAAGGPHYIPLFPDSTPSADIRSQSVTEESIKNDDGIGPYGVKVIVRECETPLRPEPFGVPFKEQAEKRLQNITEMGLTVPVSPFVPHSIIELGVNPVGVVKGTCEFFNAVYISLFYLDRQGGFSCGTDISERLGWYLEDPKMRDHFHRLSRAEYDQWLYGLKNATSEGNRQDCCEALSMMLRVTVYLYMQGWPKLRCFAFSPSNVPPECTLMVFYSSTWANAKGYGSYASLLPRPRTTLAGGTYMRQRYQKYDISVPQSQADDDVPTNGHVMVEIIHPEVLPNNVPKPQAYVPPSEDIADEILSNLISIQQQPPELSNLSNWERIRDIARSEHLYPFVVAFTDGHSLTHAVHAALHYASYAGDFHDGNALLDALLSFLSHPFVSVQYSERFQDFNAYLTDLKAGIPCNYAHAIQALAQCFCISIYLYGPEKIRDRVFYPTNKTSVCSIAISQRSDGAFYALLPHFNLGSETSRAVSVNCIKYESEKQDSTTPDDYQLKDNDYQRIINQIIEGNDLYQQLIEHRGNVDLFPMLPEFVKTFGLSADTIRQQSQMMESEIYFATREALGKNQREKQDGPLRPDQEAQIRDYLMQWPDEAYVENTLFIANRFRVGPIPVVDILEECEWENKLKKLSGEGVLAGRVERLNIFKRCSKRV